jgi:hypothetical protein
LGIKVAFLAGADAPDAAPSGARAVRLGRAGIRGSQGDEFVFVVGRDDKLERRAVKLGAGSGDLVEVVAGLPSGERVVLEGPADLAAGMVVAERKAE